ncbi:hypothetical protein C2E23DRAFT_810196 [Lenzites betulinus]|nr:hypothetical protein C2E23DRAFT_810196 [Lenzites betulinus]
MCTLWCFSRHPGVRLTASSWLRPTQLPEAHFFHSWTEQYGSPGVLRSTCQYCIVMPGLPPAFVFLLSNFIQRSWDVRVNPCRDGAPRRDPFAASRILQPCRAATWASRHYVPVSGRECRGRRNE